MNKKENHSERNFRVINSGDLQALGKFAGMVVSKWHDEIKPDYVFLNETSAVPLGYVLKEAWKKAYPDQEAPIFYRVNPAVLSMKGYHKDYDSLTGISSKITKDPRYQKRVNDFFKTRIKKRGATVLILDEHSESGRSSWAVSRAIHQATGISLDNIYVENGKEFDHNLGDRLDKYTKLTQKEIHSMSGYSDSEELWLSSPEKVELRGKIRKNKEGLVYSSQTFNLLDYVHDLKQVGRIAGEAIREGRFSRHKTLERVVAVATAVSFLGLVLFLSPNVTGNVIGSLSQISSNWIGGILFVIGVFGAFIYFKLKKYGSIQGSNFKVRRK